MLRPRRMDSDGLTRQKSSKSSPREDSCRLLRRSRQVPKTPLRGFCGGLIRYAGVIASWPTLPGLRPLNPLQPTAHVGQLASRLIAQPCYAVGLRYRP